ncbi:MAG: adenosylcobinamide-GDP ribazoletransferase [Solirubrobacteraceae bacterium]|nr:adenosylcobinamide-GDP ribazoletransferase [Solirubrobacteraceae bacterium]
MGPARRAAAGAALALAFLTVIPLRVRERADGVGAAAAWFPAVGALVGALAGGIRFASEPLLGAGPAAVLAVAVLVAVTGALHQDGLADCADGLGVRDDRGRRLAVMRDPSVGVFGALALLLWALLVAAALAELPREDALPALVVAGALGRWAAVLHGAGVAPARRAGLGASFRVGRGALAAATLTAVAAALGPAGLGAGAAALAAAAVVTLGVSAWASRTLGGRTGDTLGASVALVEAAVLLVLLGFANAA